MYTAELEVIAKDNAGGGRHSYKGIVTKDSSGHFKDGTILLTGVILSEEVEEGITYASTRFMRYKLSIKKKRARKPAKG